MSEPGKQPVASTSVSPVILPIALGMLFVAVFAVCLFAGKITFVYSFVKTFFVHEIATPNSVGASVGASMVIIVFIGLPILIFRLLLARNIHKGVSLLVVYVCAIMLVWYPMKPAAHAITQQPSTAIPNPAPQTVPQNPVPDPSPVEVIANTPPPQQQNEQSLASYYFGAPNAVLPSNFRILSGGWELQSGRGLVTTSSIANGLVNCSIDKLGIGTSFALEMIVCPGAKHKNNGLLGLDMNWYVEERYVANIRLMWDPDTGEGNINYSRKVGSRFIVKDMTRRLGIVKGELGVEHIIGILFRNDQIDLMVDGKRVADAKSILGFPASSIALNLQTYRAASYRKLTLTKLNLPIEGKSAPMLAPARPVTTTTGGQIADDSFDITVPHPAYPTGKGPVVMFDEAHHNFHKSDGRYKPLADLLRNDGYRIVPNRSPLTDSELKSANILLISNALHKQNDSQQGGSWSAAVAPAFTSQECEAVAAWVQQGGSLLFIADHHPFGKAAQNLANVLGVKLSEDSATGEGVGLYKREDTTLQGSVVIDGRNDSERVNTIRSFGGEALLGPAGCINILCFSKDAVLYSSSRDIAKEKRRYPMPAGYAQATMFHLGKGKVFVSGEAGLFSAQTSSSNHKHKMGMNYPGVDNKQFALNVLHWLSNLLNTP